MSDAITFRRPDPTEFVLLIARVGAGTGNVDPQAARRHGLQHFKPAGTEYATDKDLADAGYVRAAEGSAAHDVVRLRERVRAAVEQLRSAETSDEAAAALDALEALVS